MLQRERKRERDINIQRNRCREVFKRNCLICGEEKDEKLLKRERKKERDINIQRNRCREIFKRNCFISGEDKDENVLWRGKILRFREKEILNSIYKEIE